MGVQQHDFIGFRAVDLAGMAQAQHVFGVVAAVVMAHAGLRCHEGFKPFLAQFCQHGGGGDVGVPFGTAFVRGVREDGRGYAADLVVGQWVVAAQRRGMGSETGCELHGLSPDKVGC